MTTGWSDNCTLTKFNSTLDTLLSVSITVAITIRTDAQIENQDNQPVPVTITRGADINLRRPDNSPLVSFIPTIQNTENFTAYAGTSGATYIASSTSDSRAQSFATGDPNFSLFVGAGPAETIVLPITANSILTFSALTANFASIVNTFALANVSIVYSYQVPDAPVVTPVRRARRLIRTGGSDN